MKTVVNEIRSILGRTGVLLTFLTISPWLLDEHSVVELFSKAWTTNNPAPLKNGGGRQDLWLKQVKIK